jgi:hypothetical protein
MLLLPDLSVRAEPRTAQGSGDWRQPAIPYRGHTFDPFPPGPTLDARPTAHGKPRSPSNQQNWYRRRNRQTLTYFARLPMDGLKEPSEQR